MTKEEIYRKIRESAINIKVTPINSLLLQHSQVTEKTDKDLVFDLNDILMEIMRTPDLEQKTAQIGYFFHLLLDCPFDDISNIDDIKISFRDYVKERLKNNNLCNLLMHYRKPNNVLLEFVLNLPVPSLKELVHISYVEPQENWLDPFTKKVMDIPVSYMVDGTKYICDLNPLLNNSDDTCLILCPFTKKYLQLSQIHPCYDILQEIQATCHNTYGQRGIQEALNEALTYAMNNELAKLQAWHRKNPSISLNEPFLAKNRENPKGDKWTIAHMASRMGNFDILCWLLEQHLSLFEVKDAKDRTPLKLLTRHLEQLISDCKAQPSNHALQLLLIMYCNVMKCEEKSVMSLEELTSGEKPYPEALFWQSNLVPHDSPDFMEKILPILNVIVKIFITCNVINNKGSEHKLYSMFPVKEITSHLFNRLQEIPIIDRSIIDSFYGLILSSLAKHGTGYQAIRAVYYTNLAYNRVCLNHKVDPATHNKHIKHLLELIIPAGQEHTYMVLLDEHQEKVPKTKNTPMV
jgi:hypothetical protein